MKANNLLYLEQYTYYNICYKKALLVNLADDSYTITNNQKEIDLLKRIKENDGCCFIDQEETKEYASFIENIRSKFMGDIMEAPSSGKLPMMFPIQLNYGTREQHLREIKDHSNERGLEYIMNVKIFTSDEAYSLFGSFIYFQHTDGNNINRSMSTKEIEQIMKTCARSINLCDIACFITDVEQLDEIIYQAKENHVEEYLNLHMTDLLFSDNKQKILELTNLSNKVHIIIYLSSNNHILEDSEQINYRYIIKDENDVECFIQTRADNPTKKIMPQVVMTGNNEDFLKNTLYTDYQKALEKKNKKFAIERNMFVNTNFFGTVLFMPDYQAGLLTKKGLKTTLHSSTDELERFIIEDLENQDNYWFATRDDDKCSKCIMQYLCPPMTNIEIISGSSKFCDIE